MNPADLERRFGGDQGPGELHLAEHGLDRDPHQQLVEVGREGFAAPLVLPVEQVAAFFHRQDHAFVAAFLGGLPAHAVAHHGFGFLATRVAQQARPLGGFDQQVAAVAGHDQAAVAFLRGGLAFAALAARAAALGSFHGFSPSTRAAQMKSFSERPPTEWVDQRTVQRL